MIADARVMELLATAKRLAREYYAVTGKPLGITGEVAEYEAARILGLGLTPARQSGYDATEQGDRGPRRLQIKGRCLQENHKPGQRLGSIQRSKEWDAVLLVLLDHNTTRSRFTKLNDLRFWPRWRTRGREHETSEEPSPCRSSKLSGD